MSKWDGQGRWFPIAEKRALEAEDKRKAQHIVDATRKVEGLEAEVARLNGKLDYPHEDIAQLREDVARLSKRLLEFEYVGEGNNGVSLYHCYLGPTPQQGVGDEIRLPEHRCGVMGFDPALGDVCPACQAYRQQPKQGVEDENPEG